MSPPSLSPAQRRWALAAAISCVAVFGLAIGLGGPLLSLIIERRGVEASVNGLNAAATFIGVIVGPLLTPVFVHRLGLRRFLLSCLLIDVVLWPLFKLFDSLEAWFVLRAVTGLLGSSLFTATEAWISVIAGDESRGRVIGIYAAALSLGFGMGPLLLAATGFEGWAPFVVGCALGVAAALPFFFTGDIAMGFGEGERGSVIAVCRRAPFIVLAVALFGLYESAALTLLPIWGVRLGFDPRLSAATLTSLYVGSIALQVPIGWLSDRFPRLRVLRLCAAGGLIGAALLPLFSGSALGLGAVLLIWGGLASGLYPVALSMAGDRFRGAEMVTANAALIMAYGVGALVGPVLGGAAMDLWNPNGLIAVFVLAFGLFLAFSWIPRAEDAARTVDSDGESGKNFAVSE